MYRVHSYGIASYIDESQAEISLHENWAITEESEHNIKM